MLHEGILPITQIRLFKLFRYLNNSYDSLNSIEVIKLPSDFTSNYPVSDEKLILLWLSHQFMAPLNIQVLYVAVEYHQT